MLRFYSILRGHEHRAPFRRGERRKLARDIMRVFGWRHMRQRGHSFRVACTPMREVSRWRCKFCALQRRRVAPVSSAAFGFTRSFWLYRQGCSGAWSTLLPACPGVVT